MIKFWDKICSCYRDEIGKHIFKHIYNTYWVNKWTQFISYLYKLDLGILSLYIAYLLFHFDLLFCENQFEIQKQLSETLLTCLNIINYTTRWYSIEKIAHVGNCVKGPHWIVYLLSDSNHTAPIEAIYNALSHYVGKVREHKTSTGIWRVKRQGAKAFQEHVKMGVEHWTA